MSQAGGGEKVFLGASHSQSHSVSSLRCSLCSKCPQAQSQRFGEESTQLRLQLSLSPGEAPGLHQDPVWRGHGRAPAPCGMRPGGAVSRRGGHSYNKEIPGLISFRMDWLDLLVVQGTLKSLLPHHSSKASILWCSALFTVQLSHPSDHRKNHSLD